MTYAISAGRRRHSGGNALIEFALALQMAVREGARYAAFKTYDSGSSTPSSAFSTSVKNAVVYGNPAGGTTPIVPNLTTANVNLTVTWTNGIPTQMIVSIQNYTIDAFLKTFAINKPSASFNYVGVYAAP
jgi:hypothetical protein